MSEDFYSMLSADELAKIENMTLEEFENLENIAKNFQPRQLKGKQQNPVDDFDDSFDDLVDDGFIDISNFENYVHPSARSIFNLDDFAPRNIDPSNFVTNNKDAIINNRQAIQNIIAKFDQKKTPLINRSRFTRNDVQRKFPNIDISKIPDEEFKMMYLTPTGELIKKSPNKLPDFEKISRAEYQDIFNSRLDLLNEIIEKNRKGSSKPYEITGLNNSSINFKSEFGESNWPVDITPGLFRGQVENIANPNYIANFPGIAMFNTMQGVYGRGKDVIRGTKAYDSIREYLKKIDLGSIKSGQSGQTPYSKGLWESIPRKGKGFGIYLNPDEVGGIYYKEGGEPMSIGDEVDYETMLQLKELGYEFE